MIQALMEPACSALFFSWEITKGRSKPLPVVTITWVRLTGTVNRTDQIDAPTGVENPPCGQRYYYRGRRNGKPPTPTSTPSNNTNYERFNRNKHISVSKMHYYRCCWQSYGHLLQTRGLNILSCFYHARHTPDWEIHNW